MTQNPNTTTDLIAELTYQMGVMQALLDGKKILCRPKTGTNVPWMEAVAPVWNWEVYDYKVEEPKREPMVLHAAFYKCDNAECPRHLTAAGLEQDVRDFIATAPAHVANNLSVSRFIEVLED